MKDFSYKVEVVNGKCPTCDEFTMLIGVTKEIFRCMSCGADLEPMLVVVNNVFTFEFF